MTSLILSLLVLLASPASPSTLTTKLLSPRTQTTGCVVRGSLPDPHCTPGAIYTEATRSVLCAGGWSATVRDVSAATKREVYASYGIQTHTGATYEMDHLVPLELGGSNDAANLFPEAASPTPGFHEKDRVEGVVTRYVCRVNGWRLSRTQRAVARNWVRFLPR